MSGEHPDGDRILAYDERGPGAGRELVELWRREGAITDRAEAERRLSEMLLVAVDARDRLVGECSAYVARQEQLQQGLWHFRVFVAAEARRRAVGIRLALRARDLLEERWVTGADRRAPGLVYEVENLALRQVDDAVWDPVGFVYVGVTRAGAPLRVRYFPGGHAPPP